MAYPSREQVEAASHEQLCRWWRFQGCPGADRIGYDDFQDTLEREARIMDRIGERIKEFGGFTPEISKRLGWAS